MFDDEFYERILFMTAFALKGMREADRLFDQRKQIKSGQPLQLKAPSLEPQLTKPHSLIDALSELLK